MPFHSCDVLLLKIERYDYNVQTGQHSTASDSNKECFGEYHCIIPLLCLVRSCFIQLWWWDLIGTYTWLMNWMDRWKCVSTITVPRQQDIGTVTFNLTVETQDGSAGIYMYINIKSESITLVCLLYLYVLLSRWYILQSLTMTT